MKMIKSIIDRIKDRRIKGAAGVAVLSTDPVCVFWHYNLFTHKVKKANRGLLPKTV